MSIKEKILNQTNSECVSELIGKIIGATIVNLIIACWYIFASNVIFHTNFGYGFKEIFSFYLVVRIIEKIATNKK